MDCFHSRMRSQLANLSKSYFRKQVLKHLHAEFEPGQIVAILGENGAGKTTLLQIMAGLLVPTTGAVYYDEILFQRRRIDLRRRLHFLPDFPAFFAGGTVLSHLAMMMKLYETDSAETRLCVTDLLEKFDLLSLIHADPLRLSRGQAYKVALAGLIAVQPELWLLDEPFASGMDPRGLRIFREEAAAAAASGATILFSSQILAAAEQLATHVLVLHESEAKIFALDQLKQERAANADLEVIFSSLTE